MNPVQPPGSEGGARRPATLLESVEDIRSLLQAPARQPTMVAHAAPRPAAPDTETFRPSARPPMAWLCVLDDGQDEGEVVRIRATPFVIGRAEGDVVIPHDAGMSGRHVEILRVHEDGRFRWSLRDLGSTNGTFVRAASTFLKAGQELLLGGVRMRFDWPHADEPASAPAPATAKWQVAPSTAAGRAAPELVVLAPQGDGRRHRLAGPETWIGRDPTRCAVVLDQPQVSPRHARVAQDDRGRWVLHNNQSQNGLWVRVQEIALERSSQFQCGEQRFWIRVP